jgi:DNA-binding transcriptional MocR family regulator
LAQAAGTTPVTVSQAYRRLREKGLVVSRVGSGTYVAGLGTPASQAEPIPDFIHLDRREPPPILFPTDVIRQIMDRILDEEGGEAFAYGDPGGYAPLRDVLISQLVDEGFAVNGRDLVVFSGAQQALSLLLRSQVQRGDWVLVERPTYPGMLRLLERAGAQVEVIETGPDGPDPERLEHILRLRPIRLFYSMPIYHNPTGICWSPERQRQIAELCETRGVLLVEDDALGALDFGSGRQRPISVNAPACRNVVHIRSFSLVLMPGFRLGFCLAPRDLANTLKRAKEQADLLSSGFFQRVLCRFISEGHLKRHLAVIEPYYRDLFEQAVTQARDSLAPLGFGVAPAVGGPSLWCHLPEGTRAEAFERSCIRAGVSIRSGAVYAPNEATADSFAIDFGRLSPHVLAAGFARLASAASRA